MAILPQQHLELNVYGSIDGFQSRFRKMWSQADETIKETLQNIALHGICDPLTDRPIAPEAIEVVAPNYRESLVHNGLNSRERGVLLLLRQLIEAGQLPSPRLIEAYLPEAVTPLAAALKSWLGGGLCSVNICLIRRTRAVSSISTRIYLPFLSQVKALICWCAVRFLNTSTT